MMSTPISKTGLRIAFPVVDAGQYCLSIPRGTPAILIGCQTIEPGPAPDIFRKNERPQCNVIGQLQTGRKIQFTIPLDVWMDAVRNAVTFISIEKDSIGAPTIALPVRGGRS